MKATIYNCNKNGQTDRVHHVRRELKKIKSGEIDAIVDPRIQKPSTRIPLSGGDPNKVFTDKNNHPYTTTKDGRLIPIHKVRIRVNVHPSIVGSGSKSRFVALKSNHHLAAR